VVDGPRQPAIISLQTNVTIALATALVASASGTDAIAGYGTGVRLEYLLIPVNESGGTLGDRSAHLLKRRKEPGSD